ncbi:MAG: PAS domain-containing protein, partial [Actinomycetota bacterium]
MISDRRDRFEIDAIAEGQALPRVLIAALEETSSPVCITTADLDAPGPTIVYVNPAYSAMTRRPREEVIGRSPRLMQGPLTDRRVLDTLRADLTAGRRFSGATINYRADGEPFHIAWSIDPVLDDDGVATHYVATQRDVTTEVIARRLRRAEEHLDTALVDALAAPTDAETALSVVLGAVAAGAGRIAGYGTAEVTLRDPALGPVRARFDTGTEPPTDPGSIAGIQFPI